MCEIWDFSSERPKFQYTVVFVIGLMGVKRLEILKHEHLIKKEDVDLSKSEEITLAELWPLPTQSMTRLDGPIGDDVYVKEPDFGNYDMLRVVLHCLCVTNRQRQSRRK
jgi:hypothetical protein